MAARARLPLICRNRRTHKQGLRGWGAGQGRVGGPKGVGGSPAAVGGSRGPAAWGSGAGADDAVGRPQARCHAAPNVPGPNG